MDYIRFDGKLVEASNSCGSGHFLPGCPVCSSGDVPLPSLHPSLPPPSLFPSLLLCRLWKLIGSCQQVPVSLSPLKMPTKQVCHVILIHNYIMYCHVIGVRGCVVSPSTPRMEQGIYWGYRVRMADTFAAVFTEAPYEVRRKFGSILFSEYQHSIPFQST